jgi:hypothetical protein
VNNLRDATEQLQRRLDEHSEALGIDPRQARLEDVRRELVDAARRAARAKTKPDTDRELHRVLDAAIRLEAIHNGGPR